MISKLYRATLAAVEPRLAAEEPLWGVPRNIIPEVASNIDVYWVSSFASINAYRQVESQRRYSSCLWPCLYRPGSRAAYHFGNDSPQRVSDPNNSVILGGCKYM